MAHARAHPPAEDHLRRDARRWCSRSPDLLLGLQVQPLDDHGADGWPDDVRLSDLEPQFTCQACGQRGADARPDFDWERTDARPGGPMKAEAGRLTKTL